MSWWWWFYELHSIILIILVRLSNQHLLNSWFQQVTLKTENRFLNQQVGNNSNHLTKQKHFCRENNNSKAWKFESGIIIPQGQHINQRISKQVGHVAVLSHDLEDSKVEEFLQIKPSIWSQWHKNHCHWKRNQQNSQWEPDHSERSAKVFSDREMNNKYI